jgi:hypothetical protein
MLAVILHSLGSNPGAQSLDPGDAGWGDVLFVSIWAIGSLLLAAYYCYKAFFSWWLVLAFGVVSALLLAVFAVAGTFSTG